VCTCVCERELIDWFNAISPTGLECPTYNEITSRTEGKHYVGTFFIPELFENMDERYTMYFLKKEITLLNGKTISIIES
jgi:hypothetical protein